MKKIIALITVAFLFIIVIPAKPSSANDIANHQMKIELTYWAEKKVILPDAKGNYNPNKMVTRGEFASYITRALKLPANKSYTFNDIKTGTRLAEEVSAAAAAGIVSGYPDGKFKPNDKISRQHMAAMIYRALSYKKIPLKSSNFKFADNSKISKQYSSAVSTNVYYGIIRGATTSKGTMFNPQQNASIAHAAAFLYRMQKTIDKPLQVAPPVDTRTYYYVGYTTNNKIVKNETKYETYNAALSTYDANKSTTLIFKGDKILKTKNDSIAFVTDRTADGDTATIYLDKNFSKAFTYVAEGSELDYLGSNETYTLVKVGDVEGYAKTSEITIQPLPTLSGRSYYFVSNGHLVHKIYNYATKQYSGEYQTGNAPSFMKAGERYYSLDGVQFKNSAGKLVGTYYNYYQFASVRKYTKYTAQELNNIINTLLVEREKLNPTKYKNASKNSKLIGLGSFLKKIESEYKVNALFILSSAMHESDYGMSENAQTKNNLFGIRVFDSSPEEGSKYKKPEDSVYAFMKEYINKNYVPQSGYYANGAVPGTKNIGINVYYASDAYWGSKIAGHMYRIDERFGKKEYKSAAKIGMVLNDGKAVRTYTGPSTTSSIAFTYKAKPTGDSGLFGFPVIIMEEKKGTDGKTWYKVFSDNQPKSSAYTRYVWIPASYVKNIDTK